MRIHICLLHVSSWRNDSDSMRCHWDRLIQVQRMWSCFNLTFWPMPISSSMREDLSTIFCRGTDSPGWIFLPPQIFRLYNRNPCSETDWLCHSDKKESSWLFLLPQFKDGKMKTFQVNSHFIVMMFTSRLFSPLPLLLTESCRDAGRRTCANRASTSDNITPRASLLTSASQQEVGKKSPNSKFCSRISPFWG